MPDSHGYSLQSTPPHSHTRPLHYFLKFICEEGVRALDSIHIKGIGHNDIKASNMRVDVSGGNRLNYEFNGLKITLIDFGLASTGEGDSKKGTFFYRLSDWTKEKTTSIACIDFFALSQTVINYLIAWGS